MELKDGVYNRQTVCNMSYVFAGENAIDCEFLLYKLKTPLVIKMLMIAGGGITNWTFAQSGLIDEISVVIALVADMGTTKFRIYI